MPWKNPNRAGGGTVARRTGMTGRTTPRGFALLEVMVACGLMVTAAVAAAQLAAMTVRACAISRARAAATVMAAQKMEQLRSLEWSETRDVDTGARLILSDVSTDLSVDPPGESGPGLQPSPGGTLDANRPPYVDYLDADGQWTGNGSAPTGRAVYTRRWSVEPLGDDPTDSLLLQVQVSWPGDRRSAASRADSVRLVSVRTRVAQ